MKVLKILTFRTIKKKKYEEQKEANKARRREEIELIQSLYAEGYSKTEIRKILHTSYNRIRKYLNGDPSILCEDGRANSRTSSQLDQHYEEIIRQYHEGVSKKKIYYSPIAKGYKTHLTTFYGYCSRILVVDKNSTRTNQPNTVVKRYVLRSDIFKSIWSDFGVNPEDMETLLTKYPFLSVISQCIRDFRSIFETKSSDLLDLYIMKYSGCDLKPIVSFANGLINDYEAVQNAVIYPYSNGFVEGCNNRLKMIKRTMYGRARISLLRAKIIL